MELPHERLLCQGSPGSRVAAKSEAELKMRRTGGQEIAGRLLRTRVGSNSGLVLAGNLGSEFRSDYLRQK